jgi:hypothetical protein
MLIAARSSRDFACCARAISSACRRVWLARHQRDFPGNATNVSLKPTFLCCFDRCHRFANAAPGIIELAEL